VCWQGYMRRIETRRGSDADKAKEKDRLSGMEERNRAEENAPDWDRVASYLRDV
jgi:hypothetical protein